LYGKSDQPADIQAVINLYEEGINEIFMPPKSPTGGTMGGGSNPNYEVPNGLDPTTITFKDIMAWAVQQILDTVGVDPRSAFSPKQNEGYRIKEGAIEQSRNATEYINTMIDALTGNQAKYIQLVAQDIINFKSSLPYKWLVNQIGNPPLNRLAMLKNVAIHRYGILINSYRTYMDREETRQNAQIAYQRGEIPFEVMMLINQIADPKKANYILAFEKKRTEQQKIKDEQQLSAMRMQEDASKTKNQMQLEDKKGYWWVQRENARGYWWWLTAQASDKSKAELKKMQLDAKPDEIAIKASNKIREEAAKHSLQNQTPLPPDNM
jgi:hypothetical protein